MRCWCSQRHAGTHAAFQAARRQRRAASKPVRDAERKWQIGHAVLMRAYRKNWEQAHRRERSTYLRQWWRENAARISKRAVANLKDHYVASVLRRPSRMKTFPRVLIEAKRAQLMLHRLAKEKP